MSEPEPQPNPPPEPPAEPAKPKKHPFHIVAELGIAILILFVPFVLLSSVHTGGIVSPMPNLGGVLARSLSMSMAAYAEDHDGKYPDGHSSTEVFQALIDGGYLRDSDNFFLPLKGKVQGTNGQKLKAQNVSFDVTSGVTTDDPADLPIVFVTGCKVNYVAGGTALPVVRPFPNFAQPQSTWSQWLGIESRRSFDFSNENGIYVCYKGGKTLLLPVPSTPDRSIPDFVPLSFNGKGKAYTQLTPDGPLAQ